MKWWQRILFSIISLVGGFFSLDYLFFACSLLTGSRALDKKLDVPQVVLMEFAGILLVVLWLMLILFYTRWIRRKSPKIDFIVKDKNTDQHRIKRKNFDVYLQYSFLLTGLILRWAYLCTIYFPNR